MTRQKKFSEHRIIVSLCIIIVSLFTVQSSLAQSPILKTSVDKKNILIGEQIQYNVEAVFPSGKYVVSWFNVPDSTDHMEVVTRGKIDTTENNGVINFKQSVTFTSFDSGQQTIPRFVVNFDPLKDDTTLNLFTDSVKINVGYSPLDSVKTFHDIKTIIDVKYEWPLWYYLAGADALLLLVVIIILLLRLLRKKKQPEDIFSSPLTPYDEALKSLSEIQTEQLLVKGEVKQFHVRLTEIFKRYLSRKTRSNLNNLTSDGLLLRLNEMNVSKGHVSVIANNLRLSDAVKFAKYQPSVIDSDEALANTKRMIGQLEELLNHQSTASK